MRLTFRKTVHDFLIPLRSQRLCGEQIVTGHRPAAKYTIVETIAARNSTKKKIFQAL